LRRDPTKRKSPIETAKTTIASVKREMQKPRMTESARIEGKDHAAPVVDKPPTGSEKE
jgi:hypothetical protein